MSHEATNWAIKQRGLSPAAKIVLWHLCDRYHPDHGCFPSQQTLARDCEISESGLNNHLNTLERAGLIARERRADAKTRKRKSTVYRLGFEDGFQPVAAANEAAKAEKPTPENGDGKSAEANSKTGQKPSPKSGQSHLQNLETNPVREPVREPVKERARASADVQAPDGREKAPAAETATRDTWKRRFKKAHKDWPTFVSDSEDRAEREWFALSEADRDTAANLMAVYVQEVKASGRTKFCAFAVFLRERRWEKLPGKALRAVAPASVLAPPYGKAWGALRFADLMRAPYGHIAPLTATQERMIAAGTWSREVLLKQKQAAGGWPRVNILQETARRRRKGVPANPDLAELTVLFGRVAKGSSLYRAWKSLHETRGWPWLGEDRDLPDWLYLPEPPQPPDSYLCLRDAVAAALARFEKEHAKLTLKEAAE